MGAARKVFFKIDIAKKRSACFIRTEHHQPHRRCAEGASCSSDRVDSLLLRLPLAKDCYARALSVLLLQILPINLILSEQICSDVLFEKTIFLVFASSLVYS